MASDAFLDTNILVYSFSDEPRAGTALKLLRQGGVISVQSLSEFASVALRKMKLSWPEARAALAAIQAYCEVTGPVDLALHHQALEIAERHGFGVFDAMLIGAALRAGCRTFWSEDLQHGQVIERQLTIRDPFA